MNASGRFPPVASTTSPDSESRHNDSRRRQRPASRFWLITALRRSIIGMYGGARCEEFEVSLSSTVATRRVGVVRDEVSVGASELAVPATRWCEPRRGESSRTRELPTKARSSRDKRFRRRLRQGPRPIRGKTGRRLRFRRVPRACESRTRRRPAATIGGSACRFARPHGPAPSEDREGPAASAIPSSAELRSSPARCADTVPFGTKMGALDAETTRCLRGTTTRE